MNSLKACLVCAGLSFAMASAFALPRAAEDINAPVTVGADVARPKVSAKPAKASAKSVKKNKSATRPHARKIRAAK